MPKQQSEETRRKIGNGVREAAKTRRALNSNMGKNMQKVAEGFAKGHPDGKGPSKVRNYGDFGVVPREAVNTDHASASLPERKEYDPKRIEEFKKRKEGEKGGQVKPSSGGA